MDKCIVCGQSATRQVHNGDRLQPLCRRHADGDYTNYATLGGEVYALNNRTHVLEGPYPMYASAAPLFVAARDIAQGEVLTLHYDAAGKLQQVLDADGHRVDVPDDAVGCQSDH